MDMRTITLQVSGRTRTFSEEELVDIVEEYEAIVALLGEHQATTQKKEEYAKTTHTKITDVQTPTEGKWFEVRPAEIEQRLFSKQKSDQRQERTRQLILEAFAEMKNNSKYARPFKTLIPEKTWDVEYVSKLRAIACHLGDHMADWVEQALKWAQRIANGETWKAVCNAPDTANWYRLIEWKNGYARLVGGSRNSNYASPASAVSSHGCNPNNLLHNAVPLVVSYK